MPRGKRPRKAKRNSSFLSINDAEEKSIYIENLKKDFAATIAKMDVEVNIKIQSIRNKCDLLLFSIPPDIGNKPLRYLTGDDNLLPVAKSSSSKRRSRSHSPNFAVPQEPGMKKRISSSCSRTTKTTKKANAFLTPSNRVLSCATYNTITPKINPNVPLMMMRRPRHGEVAVSLCGSPLLVSAISEPMVNVNIPMKNGSVMSILPEPGLQPRDLPEFLDAHTKEQLQTIYNNLKNII